MEKRLSPHIRLMTLLGEMGDVRAVRERLEGSDDAEAAELLGLLIENVDGCERVVQVQKRLRAAARDVEDVAACYDSCAGADPVAAAALYSLGNPAVLAQATAEVVGLLATWGVLHPAARVLDLGCGSGRLAAALAPRVGAVEAVDVSSEMVRHAQRATAPLSNVTVRRGTGTDLDAWPTRHFDLVLAVDMWPHVHELGPAAEGRLAAEVARVTRPGGIFAIFNYSHGQGAETDADGVTALALAHGFSVAEGPDRPFLLWDAAVWRLARRLVLDAPPEARGEGLGREEARGTDLARHLHAAQTELRALRESWTWRATAPMRHLLDRLPRAGLR